MSDTTSDREKIQSEIQAGKGRMEKSVESFQKNILQIRSSRASASMLDQIRAEYYGTMTPLSQIASITTPEPRMLLLTPYDANSMKNIKKALIKSDLGMNPQNDGNLIRLVLPELSMERRQELVKQLKLRLEDARVSLRNIRRDANEEIKKLKSSGISEDEIKTGQTEIQKATDLQIQKCEKIASEKEKSILTI